MKIQIEEGTAKIEAKEYIHISGVSEFVIPKSVKKIGDSAFSVYTDMIPTLQRFTVDKENPNFDEIDGVLVSKDRKRLIAFPIGRKGSFTVPDGIEIIEKSAFRMGKFLDEIIIPNSVKKIEKGAFYYCTALKNLHLGSGIEVVGEQAFYYCTDLQHITGGEGITRIRKKAFEKCAELEEFVFSDTVKEIDEEAFYGCDKAFYTMGRGIEKIGDKAFVGKNISIKVPKTQEYLLSGKIFAMNDKRKFAINTFFEDKNLNGGFADEKVVLCGKLNENNIVIKDNQFDFYSLSIKKEIKNKTNPDDKLLIKPILIDEVSGMSTLWDMVYDVVGVCDRAKLSFLNINYTSLVFITENGFVKKSLTDIDKNIPLHLESDYENGLSRYTTGSFRPYIYEYGEDIIIDLSYDEQHGEWIEDYGLKPQYIKSFAQLWKINVNKGTSEKITDKDSPYFAFVEEQRQYLLSRANKVEHFIQGSIFGEDFRKAFKVRYGSFTVPDTEESLSYFYEDSNGNLFNYGSAAVFDKSQKLNIGTRRRSYLNIYSKSGEKIAVVKFMGIPIYVKQVQDVYYVCTQQRRTSKKQATMRLYKFMLKEDNAK